MNIYLFIEISIIIVVIVIFSNYRQEAARTDKKCQEGKYTDKKGNIPTRKKNIPTRKKNIPRRRKNNNNGRVVTIVQSLSTHPYRCNTTK
jgi:hypothetical protein